MNVMLGRYRLIRLLATGGMGEVFLAQDESTLGAERVVVKRILRHLANDQGFIDLFETEAKLAMQVRHPNVVAVHGFERVADTWIMVMEFVEGQSLRRILEAAKERSIAIAPPLAVRMISLSLQGLHAAHEAADSEGRPMNILHGDVSPENILVSTRGQVKLTDFGVARARRSGETSGRLKGKIGYLAPEVLNRASPDRRADIFSMGVVLHEALLLEPPPHSEVTVVEGTVSAPRFSVDARIPPGLQNVIRRSLEANRSDRFPTALAMSEALESWLVASHHTVLPTEIAKLLELLFGPTRGTHLQTREPSTALLPRQAALLAGFDPLSDKNSTTEALTRTDLHGAFVRRITTTRLTLFAGVGSAIALAIAAAIGIRSLPDGTSALATPDASTIAVDNRVSIQVDMPIDAGTAVVADSPPSVVADTPSSEIKSKPPTQMGMVKFRLPAGTEVFLGSRNLGVGPSGSISLPAGQVTLTLKNKKMGIARRRTVKVIAGKQIVVRSDLTRDRR